MRTRKTVLSIIVLCIVVSLSSCLAFDTGSSNPDKRMVSGTVLKAIKDTMIATTTTAQQLCDQGVLSDNDCIVIEQSYNEGVRLVLSAKKAWDDMVVIDSLDTRETYDELITSIVRLTTNIEIIVRGED